LGVKILNRSLHIHVVKIVVLQAYGGKIGAVDFGNVVVDEYDDAVCVEKGAAEATAKRGKGDLQTRLFLPRKEVAL
jgi:hypothetical protein